MVEISRVHALLIRTGWVTVAEMVSPAFAGEEAMGWLRLRGKAKLNVLKDGRALRMNVFLRLLQVGEQFGGINGQGPWWLTPAV